MIVRLENGSEKDVFFAFLDRNDTVESPSNGNYFVSLSLGALSDEMLSVM